MTPEQEEQVRRALGAVARAEDGPERQGIPHDVAARLDEVLHELVVSRTARTTSSPVAGQDELAARRQRRWPHGLVAAAAVAARAPGGGGGATQGVGGGGSPSGAAPTRPSGSTDQVAPEDGRRGLAPKTPSPGDGGGNLTPEIPSLSSRTLTRDVEQVVALGREAYLSPPKNNGRKMAPPLHAAGVPCQRPAVPARAKMVDVRLDGEPATLLLGPLKDKTRVAQVYSCVNASALTRTIRVPSGS